MGFNIVKKHDDGKILLYELQHDGVSRGAYVGTVKASEKGFGVGIKAVVGALSSAIGGNVTKEEKIEYDWDKYITKDFATKNPEIKEVQTIKDLDKQVSNLSGIVVEASPFKEVSPNAAIVTPSGTLLSTSTGTMDIHPSFTLDKIKKRFTD